MLNKKNILSVFACVLFLSPAMAWDITVTNPLKMTVGLSIDGIGQVGKEGTNMFSSGCFGCQPLKIIKQGNNWTVKNAGQIERIFHIPPRTTVKFQFTSTQALVCPKLHGGGLMLGKGKSGQLVPMEVKTISTEQNKKLVEAWEKLPGAVSDVSTLARDNIDNPKAKAAAEGLKIISDLSKGLPEFLANTNTCTELNLLLSQNVDSGDLEAYVIR